MFFLQLIQTIPELRVIVLVFTFFVSIVLFVTVLQLTKLQLDREPPRETIAQKRKRLKKVKWRLIFSMIPYVNLLLIPYVVIKAFCQTIASVMTNMIDVFQRIFKY